MGQCLKLQPAFYKENFTTKKKTSRARSHMYVFKLQGMSFLLKGICFFKDGCIYLVPFFIILPWSQGPCKPCTIGEIHPHHPFGTRPIGSNDSVFLGMDLQSCGSSDGLCFFSSFIIVGSGKKWLELKGIMLYWKGAHFSRPWGRYNTIIINNMFFFGGIFVTSYDLMREL